MGANAELFPANHIRTRIYPAHTFALASYSYRMVHLHHSHSHRISWPHTAGCSVIDANRSFARRLEKRWDKHRRWETSTDTSYPLTHSPTAQKEGRLGHILAWRGRVPFASTDPRMTAGILWLQAELESTMSAYFCEMKARAPSPPSTIQTGARTPR